MKVKHLVEVEMLKYYYIYVDDDTDHPMTDPEIRSVVEKHVLEYGVDSPKFDTLDCGLYPEDINRIEVVSTQYEDGTDITDQFIDIQRGMKKEA